MQIPQKEICPGRRGINLMRPHAIGSHYAAQPKWGRVFSNFKYAATLIHSML